MNLPDQAARDRIRTDLDTNLVVEAAAGTGKTTALVGRLLEILAQGHGQVEGLVAVTFTERAAGELKLRLRSRLEEERAKAEGQRRTNLEKALAHLEEARINTIHGFCSELLRERPVEARLDPQFATLTDGAARKLFAQAFELWFQQRLAEPPEGVRRALRRSPKGWERQGPVERLREAARTLSEYRDFTAPWQRQPWDREGELRHLRGLLRQLCALLEQCDYPSTDDFYSQLRVALASERTLAREEEVYGRVHDDTLEAALVELFDGIKWVKLGGARKPFGPGLTRGDVWAELKRLKEGLADFVQQADADLAACLQQELRGAVEAYEEAKRRQGKLDFHDLLLGARRLLLADGATRGELQRKITHLFIDEFQDTDPLQAEILLLLAGGDPDQADWRQVRVPPGKLFVVADPKQSIYRFRRADVGIYQEVKDRLVAQGAAALCLSASFRSRPNLQRAVNSAYRPVMTGDAESLQASYVALEPVRPDTAQPSVVVLPVPCPYSDKGRVDAKLIVASEPQVVANFVAWLLQSGWTTGEGRALEPGDICILLKRFVNFGDDLAGSYARALESRGIPHLLVGGRGYHDRGEVAGIVAALTAIEWPDDELSVYATLHGPLMAFGDGELLEYHALTRHFHPLEVPDELPAHLQELGEALRLLGTLHRERNQHSVGTTIGRLLAATRAHVGFILRPSGEQVLANVLRLQQLAHAYEAEGGLSFRGFVEGLIADSEGRQEGEAPILEEGSPGVRLMTAHSSKGLEFPVVILADQTAPLGKAAERIRQAVAPTQDLCAFQIGTWAPRELLALREREHRIDMAEGVRLGYVAATRAQDLLVLTGLGDGAHGEGWYAPLARALSPRGRAPLPAVPGLPVFGPDSVLERPSEVAFEVTGVRPGLHRVGEDAEVVWWGPELLTEVLLPRGGLRSEELMQEGDPAQIELDLLAYENWRDEQQRALLQAARPARQVLPAHQFALDVPLERVSVLRIGSGPARGIIYGRLVHSLLSSLAEPTALPTAARLYARALGARADEVEAAIAACRAVFEHPFWHRVQGARQVRRETPLTLVSEGSLVEGILDLAFEEAEGWTVVDFKTDLAEGEPQERYRRQVGLYVRALEQATGQPVQGVLVGV